MDRNDGSAGFEARGPAGNGRSGDRSRSRHRPRGPGNSRASTANGDFYAALDLGTNNCRLLVAQPTRRAFRVVDAFSRIVRLGEGVTGSGRLADDAMKRAVDALVVCRDKMNARGVTRRRLIATEACRIADNGEEFLTRVREATGLELEIVNRETEARLAVSGCASLVDPDAHGAIVFDIGGGSTELVLLKAGGNGFRSPFAVQQNVAAWTSLPIGVVTVSEMFGGRDVDRALFERMVAHVQEALAAFAGEVGRLSRFDEAGVHLLGTSGTVTTICGVHLGLDRYDRRRVDGTWMQRDDVVRVTGELLAMDYDQRVGNPCIGAERADLVLAGCAIFEAIRRIWPCDRVRVADRGLREGMLLTLMADDGVWRRGRRGGRRRGRSGRQQGGQPDHPTGDNS
ncbi:Ppx/GppA family phosphatase [Microbaculum sp. A6E488]|uniref:Ppx/GppA family phosphatase n=1 Tax=Microbaculum marinisediminis TaxID=2931392 RepID=A0AAW5QTF9_9HYPH|nr:Ppx/GppA phosphatase family protein [Microbaculum sp. A6E488]MCT8970953.1 Ppx/GppA family phosphatase [Microbaculum sp. A6E488]